MSVRLCKSCELKSRAGGGTIAAHKKECVILEITDTFSRDNAAACEQGGEGVSEQQVADQRSRHASVMLPKPPPALLALLGSLSQNAGQLALERRPTGSETFPCLVCSLPSLNISESRKPLQKQKVFAAAVAGGWS
ncbi:hypothetical protein HispidOSU_000693 [Sigmodon hispidus]